MSVSIGGEDIVRATGQDRVRPADLAAEANAVGLVTVRELAAGQVEVSGVDGQGSMESGGVGASAAGSVWSVAVRGRVVGYAKRPGGRERQILAGLAGQDVAPRLLCEGTDEDRVWTAAVPGRTLTEVGAEQPAACDLADLAQAWGLALAGLHTTPVGSALAVPAERPWVLSGAARFPVPGRRRPTAAQQTLLRLARSDPGLMWAVRQAADRWSERCLVHTDLAGRHVLVATAAGIAADTKVRFVDFARAGLGDPDWDVAGALELLAVLATGCRVSESVLSDYFLRGYRRAGGPGQVDSRLRGLWAIEAAWKLAGGAAAGAAAVDSGPIRYWLGRARALVGGGRPLGRAA